MATSFTDSEAVNRHAYRGYIKAVYDEGIMNGFPDGQFKPYNFVTRAQAAAILSKLVLRQGSIYRNPSYYYDSYNSTRISTVTHNNREYSSNYMIVYLNGRSTSYYLADAEVINQSSLKLGGTLYDLSRDNIEVKILDVYYRINRISYDNRGNPAVVLNSSDQYWSSLSLSDIYAVYDSRGREISKSSINRLEIQVGGTTYSLDKVAFDLSGYIEAGSKRYRFNQATLVIRDRDYQYSYYDLKDVRSRGDKLILDCGSSTSGSGSYDIKSVVFYDKDNDRELNWQSHQVQIRISSSWVYLDDSDITIVNSSRFRYDGTTYYFTDCRIRRTSSGSVYKIVDSNYNSRTGELELELELY